MIDDGDGVERLTLLRTQLVAEVNAWAAGDDPDAWSRPFDLLERIAAVAAAADDADG